MTMTLVDMVPAAVQALSLSMARALGCSLFLPFLGRRHMAALHRNAICMAVSLPQAMTYWEMVVRGAGMALNPMALAFKELLVGCMLGGLLAIPFWAFRGAFTLVDNQRGANAAQMNNPAMEADSSLLGEWVERLLLTILIEAGALWWVFEALAHSYQAWPLASLWPPLSEAVMGQVLTAYVNLMGDTLMLAAPYLLALLIIEFGMAIGSTAVQGIDVYQTAMPIKSLSALILLALSAGFYFQRGLDRLESWWNHGVLRILGMS